MGIQTTYNKPASGLPGMIYDARNRTVVTRAASGNPGDIKYGYGVMQGDVPGVNIAANDGTATEATWEGVVVGGDSLEREYPGAAERIPVGGNLHVLQQGAAWVQLTGTPDGTTGDTTYPEIAYGEPVYMSADGTFDNTAGVLLNARFLGEETIDGAAPVEFFGGVMAVSGGDSEEEG